MSQIRHAEGTVCARGRGDVQATNGVLEHRPGAEPRRSIGRGASTIEPAGLASRLVDRIGREGFERYFDGKASLRMNEQGLQVTVPSRFMADLMHRRFGSALREAAKDQAGGAEVAVLFNVREADEANGTPAAPASPAPAGPASVGRGKPPSGRPHGRDENGTAGPGPRPAKQQNWHRLETFMVGESNRMAHAAALRLAEESDEATAGNSAGGPLTRLFIHGRCGLGKTHLLQGIARRFQEKHPAAVVRYTTGEAFTNEYITAIRAGAGKCDQFRRSYRGVDLLCIDDVHFLANKQATQGELLHTFDAIDLSGARVVLASDEHPRMVRSFSEALVSRFMSGAVVKLEHPDRELRERVIASIASRRGHTIDPAGVRLLADAAGGTATVRDLEGLVTRVEAVWRLGPRDGSDGGIGLLAVQRALGIGATPEGAVPVRRPIRGEHIIASVCRSLDVELSEFTGRGRHKRVVLARAVVAHLCRKLTTMSFPEIARAMGRPNHSTIITAYQRLAGQIEVRQSAELGGPWAGMTVGEVCERLGTEIAAGA